MRITVLGAGSWGTTLAILLNYNAHRVTFWGTRDEHVQSLLEVRQNTRLLPGIPIPDKVTITSDLAHAVSSAELIVSAIPSQFLRSVAANLTHHNFHDIVIVNVAKGIENDTLMTMSEVLLDILPAVQRDNIVTLSGPSFAEEVAKRVPTAIVAASSSLHTAKHAQKIF